MKLTLERLQEGGSYKWDKYVEEYGHMVGKGIAGRLRERGGGQREDESLIPGRPGYTYTWIWIHGQREAGRDVVGLSGGWHGWDCVLPKAGRCRWYGWD